MAKILLLHDKDGFFQGDLLAQRGKRGVRTLDAHALAEKFSALGHTVTVCSYARIDVTQEFRGTFVLYASSQDLGLFYKSYMEDVLSILKRKGAVLLPDLDYMRAHSNKSYMTMLRANIPGGGQGKSYGSLEELRENLSSIRYPVVVKASEGSGSSGVMLARNEKELMRKARRLNSQIYIPPVSPYMLAVCFARWMFDRYGTGPRTKFIIEPFVGGLGGDYKVLVFYDRYYVLFRDNRDNDFRASGSGKLHVATGQEEYTDLLEYARKISREIHAPLLSLDIGVNTEGSHLLEFQCVNFGPACLQKSMGYYTNDDRQWQWNPGPSILEAEYVRAIDLYIRQIAREGSEG